MKVKLFFLRHWGAFRSAGFALILLGTINVFCDQWFTTHIQDEIRSFQGPTYRLWVYGLGSLVFSMVVGLFQILFLLGALSPHPPPTIQSWGKLIHLKAKNLLIEQLRAFGSCLQWGFLFLIPGFIRYILLLFVPFVVLFDVSYEQGQRDALKQSSAVVRRHFKSVLFLFFVFSILWPLLTTGFDEYKSFLLHPFWAMVLVIIDIQITLFFIQLLLRLWEKNYESDLSLERN